MTTGDNLTYAFDNDHSTTNNDVFTNVTNVPSVTIDSATFDIDRGTGQISVGTNSDLNHEVAPTYDVVVTATDPSGTVRLDWCADQCHECTRETVDHVGTCQHQSD